MTVADPTPSPEAAARVRDQLAILKEQAFGAVVHDNVVVPIQAGKRQ